MSNDEWYHQKYGQVHEGLGRRIHMQQPNNDVGKHDPQCRQYFCNEHSNTEDKDRNRVSNGAIDTEKS
jgi:hypothetical protein